MSEAAGEWMPLWQLHDGAIFETRDGIRAVRSEYRYSGGTMASQCVLLESGEYAHFRDGDDTEVRELTLPKSADRR